MNDLHHASAVLLSALGWSSLSATLTAMPFAMLERRRGGGHWLYWVYAVFGARLLLPLPAPWSGVLTPSPIWTGLALLWLGGTIWTLGGMFVRAMVVYRTALLNETATPEAASAAFVDARRRVGLHSRPALICCGGSGWPAMTIGLARPIVTFSRTIAGGNARTVLHVLCHELTHLKQGDLVMNALWQLIASLHWFNPCVAYLARRARFLAEARCDERTCRALGGGSERVAYSRTLLAEGSAPRFHSEGMACLAESGCGVAARVERLMTPPPKNRGRLSAAAALLALAALAATPPPPARASEAPGKSPAEKTAVGTPKATAEKPPRIVKMDPVNHAVGVDPNTPFLVVRFDQPMGGGRAWVQVHPNLFPKSDKSYGGPMWLDEYTAVLAVELAPNKPYELYLNSEPYIGFRAKESGLASPSTRYQFKTGGQAVDAGKREAIRQRQLAGTNDTRKATREEEKAAAAKAPKIVRIEPANGSRNVDPNTPLLVVGFDQPMGGGYSWAQDSDDTFPEDDPDYENMRWLDDRTAVYPVRLKPDKDYKIYLNVPPFASFRAKESGLPAEGVVYTFHTGKQPPDPEQREKMRAALVGDAAAP